MIKFFIRAINIPINFHKRHKYFNKSKCTSYVTHHPLIFNKDHKIIFARHKEKEIQARVSGFSEKEYKQPLHFLTLLIMDYGMYLFLF